MIDLGSREPAKLEQAAEPEPEQRRGVFRRLRESLSKSRQALAEEISASVFEKIDDETWELLEEALILADPDSTPGADRLAAHLESAVAELSAAATGAAPPLASPDDGDQLAGDDRPRFARAREDRAARRG